MSALGSVVYYWPHVLAVVAMVVLVWRGETMTDWRVIGVAVALLALVLSALYRVLGSGVAPPLSERIGVGGWIGLVLTACVPLIAVSVAASLLRGSTMGIEARIAIVAVTAFVFLVLYPLVGMLLYGALTRVHP